MTPKDEQLRDVVENCSVLLGKLSGFQQTDDTPEGRMISQLKWLKERAEDKTLTLPVDPRYLATLRRVYTEGDLCRHASAPDKAPVEIEIYMKRLIKLTRDGLLLLKPEYYQFAIRRIEALIKVLKGASRPLSTHERGSIDELEDIKNGIQSGRLVPPLMRPLYYPNFNEMYVIFESTIDDLPDGKQLCKAVANLVFEGIRPASWATPEAAARETGSF
jgi:hypothetical protein